MRRLAATLLTLVVAAAPLSAQEPVTVTFSEYASPVTRDHPAAVGEPLRSGGFDFYSTDLFWANARNILGTWGSSPSDPGFTNRPTNLGGSTALAATLPTTAGSVDMFVAGANPLAATQAFSLYSIAVAHLYSSAYVPMLQNFTLTFFGSYPGSMTNIQQSFLITAPTAGSGGIQRPLLQTLTFDGRWHSVNNVWWSQANTLSTLHQFTNVTAAVVPEPGTYVLLATGLAGLGVVARRRRR